MLLNSAIGALGLLALVILWQVFGHGPRRARGLKRAGRRLADGAWREALERVRKLRKLGLPSAGWQRKLNDAEAACLRTAARESLTAKQFEDALGYLLEAAQILGEPKSSAKNAIQTAMLEEIRRCFSVTALGDHKPVHDLIARAFQVQLPCREASFWQGMCFLRSGELDRAMEALQAARSPGKTIVLGGGQAEPVTPSGPADLAGAALDPPLYLGALLLRQGQAKESLRYLSEANRIDGNCPVVTLQLGAAMIAAGSDVPLGVRALQRALGLRGLAAWAKEPRTAWVEGFPEARSYVRKLAATYPFVCPIWGGDLNILMQQGNLALAQGFYKLAAYAEAAEHFAKVLQNGPPSLVVLRGLGLSLARLGKYDEAFKHLRIAHEMEEPKDRITAGYLALCGAKGKPPQPADKTRNVLWALNVVMHFNAPGDREWAALINELFAEARGHSAPACQDKSHGTEPPPLTLSLDQQIYLCEHLWSVRDAGPQAAEAYHYLHATYPQAVRQEYAWLYCRAAQQHKVDSAHALELFARTFAEPEPARAFFAEQQWDWTEMEFTYLERASALDPGHFPALLGPQYPATGEELLLARSLKQKQDGKQEAALATVEILHKLAPDSPRAFDRLAYLHHVLGHPDQAMQVLEAWCNCHPRDTRPVVRAAILLHRRGLFSEGEAKLRAAIQRCDGPLRASIAFLGARLTLQIAFSHLSTESNGSTSVDSAALQSAEAFLQQCLRDEPNHNDAQWCLAAVRCLRGNVPALADQVAGMNRPEIADARFQYFVGLCRLAARDFAGSLEACSRIAQIARGLPSEGASRNGAVPKVGVNWPVESAYLAGLAHLGLGQNAQAAQTLQTVALEQGSPSATHAQALLGFVAFMENEHDEARKWWQSLDPKRRAAWKLGETLAQTVFLGALEAYTRGSFDEAADKLRAAGRLGCRDRRLGALLVTALFKAGQAMIYRNPA